MTDSVSCNRLWISWATACPDSEYVLEAKERIKLYKKQDWIDMAAEATSIVNNLGMLVENNVEYKSEYAKKQFMSLMDHHKTWFFTPTEEYATYLAMAIRNDINYTKFFNNFKDGLAPYMFSLLLYWKKIL